MNLKTWIKAARLRTLPLSMSGIIVGSFVAYKEGFWDWKIFVLCMLTTLFLQILSNYANDLGDSYKGADNEHRLGPKRAVQSGEVTQKQMKIATIVLSILSLSTAIPLIIIGTKDMSETVLWLYFILAILSVIAAITYTIGKKAYGYHGLGDVMVFVFFGLVSTLGSYSLYSKQFDWTLIGFASAIGFLSIAVLNLNNMRDHENDKAVGKKTIVVAMGFKKAKIYHSALILLAFIGIFSFLLSKTWLISIICLLPFERLFQHLNRVWKTDKPKSLDNEMKTVSLSTFSIAILFMISTFF